MKLTKLSRLAISDEGFVFDPLTGTSYTINHSAQKILQKFITGSSEEEAALTLMEDFHISDQMAERDLQDFMRQLRNFELI
jgi:hypothetical protein